MPYDFKSSIWRGVYGSFGEACGDASVFEGRVWLDKISEQAQGAVEAHKQPAAISANTARMDYILAPIVAAIYKPGEKLRILDFGGGLAASFYPLIDSLSDDISIEFHIVENQIICSRAREILPEDPRLFFHESLPDFYENFDVIHIGSSLQYVEDWKGMLKKFDAYNPGFLIFDDLTAGDIPETFASLQYYYGQEIPCWFFKLSELVSTLGSNGYSLVFKSRFIGTYFGKIIVPPMEALPESYRITNFCHLVLRKIS